MSGTVGDYKLVYETINKTPEILFAKFVLAQAVATAAQDNKLDAAGMAELCSVPIADMDQVLKGIVANRSFEFLIGILLAAGRSVKIAVQDDDVMGRILHGRIPGKLSTWEKHDAIDRTIIETTIVEEEGTLRFGVNGIPVEAVLAAIRAGRSPTEIFADNPLLPVDAIGALEERLRPVQVQ